MGRAPVVCLAVVAALALLFVIGIGSGLAPRGAITVRATAADGAVREVHAIVRIDTPEELVAFRNGGILPYVLRQLSS